jgi:hypothetical protein
MRFGCFGMAFVCMFLLAAVSAPKLPISDVEIRTAVEQLRSETASQSFEAFYKSPEDSTRILIAELKATPQGHFESGKHPQAV